MATNAKSLVTGKFRGMLGKEIVFRHWDGKTIVAKAPGSQEADPTPAQEKTRENFQMGSKYAKAVLQDPDLTAMYAAVLRPRQNIYSRALEDFIKFPEVVSIDTRSYTGQAGEKIVVRAKDDFRVVSVQVEIYAADGILLERGLALANKTGNIWTYIATRPNSLIAGSRIIAIASDVPENEGSLEVII